MTVNRVVRTIAGSFVLISLALGWWVNSNWFLFTAFVGINLVQAGITGWCIMDKIVVKLGLAEPE